MQKGISLMSAIQPLEQNAKIRTGHMTANIHNISTTAETKSQIHNTARTNCPIHITAQTKPLIDYCHISICF